MDDGHAITRGTGSAGPVRVKHSAASSLRHVLMTKERHRRALREPRRIARATTARSGDRSRLASARSRALIACPLMGSNGRQRPFWRDRREGRAGGGCDEGARSARRVYLALLRTRATAVKSLRQSTRVCYQRCGGLYAAATCLTCPDLQGMPRCGFEDRTSEGRAPPHFPRPPDAGAAHDQSGASDELDERSGDRYG